MPALLLLLLPLPLLPPRVDFFLRSPVMTELFLLLLVLCFAYVGAKREGNEMSDVDRTLIAMNFLTYECIYIHKHITVHMYIT